MSLIDCCVAVYCVSCCFNSSMPLLFFADMVSMGISSPICSAIFCCAAVCSSGVSLSLLFSKSSSFLPCERCFISSAFFGREPVISVSQRIISDCSIF